ncbi:MAG TPA: LuxR C-terminal-related transcriptional regulator [Pseudonocardiaceae bacterium]|nr:LuxR C-terminal-related transcriptional regulator [Pseudonocardiaceae bacterium]
MRSLPFEFTSFIGREDEVAEVGRLLKASRLLTLIGPGGVGKTRLAVQAARLSSAGFLDGVYMVRLDALRDPGLLAQTVADVLGLNDSTKDATAQVVRFLRDKTVLLLLDNCEHLAEACATFSDTLLSSTTDVRVLATSRHVLRVQGEQLLLVRPLPVGTGKAGTAEGMGDAVALFEDRARATVPSFIVDQQNGELVTRICSRLDGMPLAIELAAVWLRVLSLTDVLDRLDDRFRLLVKGTLSGPSRHQTLIAAVEWSHELCSPSEARLWERLSVFAGGFSLAAAEAVGVGPDDDQQDFLALFSGLIEKSIVLRNGDQQAVRYRMLETIRAYGLQKLAEAGELKQVRRRHLDFFLEMAQQAATEWLGPQQLEVVARTRQEHANIRAALEYSFADGQDAIDGARLAIALEQYWVNCGLFSESILWLDRILALPRLPSDLRINAMWIRTYAATALGAADLAADMAAEAVALAREQGDPLLLGNALLAQGGSAMVQNDYPAADAIYLECIECYATANHLSCNVILAYTARGMSAGFARSPELTLEMARRAIEISEQYGDLCIRSYALYTLAMAEWQLGNPAEALKHAQEGLAIKSQFDDILGQAIIVELCAWIASSRGDGLIAAKLLGLADQIWSRVGGAPMLDSEAWRGSHRHSEEEARSQLSNPEFQAAFNEGAALADELPHAVGFLLDADSPPVEADSLQLSDSILTRREAQIAHLIANGVTNKAIATRLTISRRTVEVHVDHILRKLNFTSRTQVAVWVVDQRRGPG